MSFAAKSTHRRQTKQVLSSAARSVFEPLESRQLMSAGGLDPSFNNLGVSVAAAFPGYTTSGSHEVVQSDGKIVVATTVTSSGGPAEVGLARFNTDGSLDSNFGTNGVVEQLVVDGSNGTGVLALGIQSNGNLVVAGYVNNGSSLQFCVSGFNSDGSFNSNFGYGGSDSSVTFAGYTGAVVNAMDVMSDDSIVLTGFTYGAAGTHTAIAKFLSNGRQDTSFGTAGTGGEVLQLGISDVGNSVASFSDGTLVIVGYANNGTTSSMAITETSSEGIPNTFFGSPTFHTGTQLLSFPSDNVYGNAVAVDNNNGRIVVGGDWLDSTNNNHEYSLVVAYTEGGDGDGSFGAAHGFTEGDNHITSIASIAIQSDDKVIMAGPSTVNSSVVELARYTSAGVLDSTFGSGGSVAEPVAGNDLQLNGDGQIVLSSASSGQVNAIRVLAGEYTFNDYAFTVGDRIQMAQYDNGGEGVAFHDTDNFNSFGPYGRGDGVDVSNGAIGNGIVGYTYPGEYLKYTIDVEETSTGSFALTFRGGDIFGTGGKFHVEDTNGTHLTGEITVPSVAGGDYKVFSGGNVTLTGGMHTLKIVFDTQGAASEVGDFDYFQLASRNASITGIVFNDANNNAKKDSGETGIPGVEVYLDGNGDGKFESYETKTHTNASGAYSFSVSPYEKYSVAVVPPVGYKQSLPTSSKDFITSLLSSGQTASGTNFGLHQAVPFTASISGNVFKDLLGNGVHASSDPAFSGVNIYIDSNNDGKQDYYEPITTTDSKGNYSFTKLAAATYFVREQLPSGYRMSSGPAATGVKVGTGAKVTNVNFGDTQKVLISGNVFNDVNDNLKQDTGEANLTSWRVYIDKNNDGKYQSTETSVLTDSKGNYAISSLPAGTYHVRVNPNSGYSSTSPTGGVYNLTLTSGQTSTARTFGERKVVITSFLASDALDLSATDENNKNLFTPKSASFYKLPLSNSITAMADDDLGYTHTLLSKVSATTTFNGGKLAMNATGDAEEHGGFEGIDSARMSFSSSFTCAAAITFTVKASTEFTGSQATEIVLQMTGPGNKTIFQLASGVENGPNQSISKTYTLAAGTYYFFGAANVGGGGGDETADFSLNFTAF